MVPYRERTKAKYSKNLFGMLIIASGAFLIIEHIFMWGEFSFFDFIGHEYGGLLLIIIGILLNVNFKTPLSSEIKALFNKFRR